MRPLTWFRADLRVQDNPALHEACREATRGVIGVFFVCPGQWTRHDWAPARVDLMVRTLAELSQELERLRVPLLVRTATEFADVPDLLLDLARHHGCDVVHYNAEYEVNERRRDRSVDRRLAEHGIHVRVHTDQVVVPAGGLRTKTGGVYTVFTPFKNAWIKLRENEGPPVPRGRPRRQPELAAEPDTIATSVTGFHPSSAISGLWPAGEKHARRRLMRFVKERVTEYDTARDRPADDGTSRLSPYLAIGALSAGQCLAAALEANGGRYSGGVKGLDVWISELIWREFYRHVLRGFPRVSMHRAFKPETERLRWRDDDAGFDAWCEGRTGFPIVDAAMRQLRETGWMHNRLRMIAAMFLCKDLMIDWRRGERFFMRNLVDGDLASNNGGWQWSASTGTDAVPYFRVFNPTRQSEKTDPDGVFIRRMVPELAELDRKAIHDPSRLPPLTRSTIDYPEPIVDHARARDRVVAAFKRL